MPREDDREYHNPHCINAVPLVLLLMPYALARFALDGARRRWRSK